MTVAALPATISYLEDGISVAFAVPFRFRSATDLVVERIIAGAVIPLAIGTDYSVIGGSTDAGGTVTRAVATNGAELRIRRSTARAQPMVYTPGDRFPAVSHEQALDRQMLIAQEQDATQADTMSRALLLPAGEVAAELAPLASRLSGGSKILGVNQGTGAIEVQPIDEAYRGPTGPANNSHAAIADLAAAAPSNLSATLASPGRGGTFRFDPSDLSAMVTSDPAQAIYIAPTIDASGHSGAWVREFDTSLNVLWFGATGNGIVSDSNAFDQAILYAAKYEAEVFAPIGTYLLDRPLIIAPKTDGFPVHSISLRGESKQGTVLKFNYVAPNACLDINPPPPGVGANGYTGMGNSYIGNFTVSTTPGQYHVSAMRVFNCISCLFENITLFTDGSAAGAGGNMTEYGTEDLRVSSGTQWCRFHGIDIYPYDVPVVQAQGIQSFFGTGISVGNGYRDGPHTDQYAISDNSFYDCRVYNRHFGVLNECCDCTSFYSNKCVQNDNNYVDRASYSALYLNPWSEGERMTGTILDEAFVQDSTGTSLRKTAHTRIISGYHGSVYFGGAVGASIEGSVNAFRATSDTQRCKARLSGADSVAVTLDAGSDCVVEYFRTTDNRFVQTLGNYPHSVETSAGHKWAEWRLERGLSLYPTNSAYPDFNGEMTFEKTSDTILTIRVQGADGVRRAAQLILA